MKRRTWMKAIACLAIAPYEAFIGDTSQVEETDDARPPAKHREPTPPRQQSGADTTGGQVVVEMKGRRYVGELGRWHLTHYAIDGKTIFELEMNQPQAVKHD